MNFSSSGGVVAALHVPHATEHGMSFGANTDFTFTRAANSIFLLKGHNLCPTKTPSWSEKSNCGQTSPKR